MGAAALFLTRGGPRCSAMVIGSAEGSYPLRDVVGGSDRVRKDGVCGECCASVKSLKRGYMNSVQAAERQVTDCGCLCDTTTVLERRQLVRCKNCGVWSAPELFVT
jgi:hypothetical protein